MVQWVWVLTTAIVEHGQLDRSKVPWAPKAGGGGRGRDPAVEKSAGDVHVPPEIWMLQ